MSEKLYPSDEIRLTVHVFETRYVSRQAYEELKAERDALRQQVAELEARQRWIPCSESLPVKLGDYLSPICLVECQEWGQQPVYAIATCWMGKDNHEPQWYLVTEFYHLERPLLIAEPVIRWRLFPLPPAPGEEEEK